MSMRAFVVLILGMLGACQFGSLSDERKYPNAAATASLVIQVEDLGAFVVNHVSLEVGAVRRPDIRTLEHMSDVAVTWETDTRARFCYVGSMDQGAPVWRGEIAGRQYEVIFDDTGEDHMCGAVPADA
ncbi:hypothetical protein [Brevundimonas sp. TWP2-3-4b2]|uniref:hypothetical protein n=1 Tax=Brevundimonas sp. TWP2-3-4b2 TaxID=2804595 RepID=UPI003CF0F925